MFFLSNYARTQVGRRSLSPPQNHGKIIAEITPTDLSRLRFSISAYIFK